MVGIVNGSGLGLNFTSYTETMGQKGVWGQAGLGQRGTQIYINGYTGNLIVQDRDGLLAGVGTDLQALRTYNSRGSFNDDNSDNWIAGFVRQAMRLTGGTWGAAGSTVAVTNEDGSERLYTWVTNRYVSTTASGPDTYLTLNAGNTLATFSDGVQSGTFEVATGRLQGWSSPTLLNAVFTYDANGRLASMASDANNTGGRIVYQYSGNLLQRVSVVDQNNIAVSTTLYAYDAASRLSRVTVDLSPADGLIADGKVYTTDYTYVVAADATNGMLRSITNSDGTSQTFKWVVSEGTARISQSWGSDGQITDYVINLAAKAARVTQPGGFTTDFWYDGLGRMKQSHPSKGANNGVTTDATRIFFEYSSNDNQATFKDYDLGITTYTYDADNNLVLIRDPAGNTVRRTYVNRLVVAETVYAVADPDGNGTQTASVPATTRFVYDAEGKLRFKISPEGAVTELRYSGKLPTSTITYLGGAYNVSGLTETQAPTEAQLTTWVAGADKSRTSRVDTVYDLRGNKLSETAYASTDAAGNGLAAGQHVVAYAYDAAGRLLSVTDGINAPVTYAYDGLGRVLTRQQGGIATSYVHQDSANGYVSTVTEQNGLVTVNTYDKMGWLLGVTRTQNSTPLGTTTNYYDPRGLLYKTRDAGGIFHWYLYDERANKVAEVDGNGTVTEFRYDVSQRPIQSIVYATPLAALSGASPNTAWADPPAAPTLASIRPAEIAGKDIRRWTVYDPAGRPIKSVDGAGFVTETRYDGTDRVVGTVRYANAIDLVAFAANPVTANAKPTEDLNNDRVTRKFYSTDGRLQGELDAEGFLVEYRYDAAGRLASSVRYADPTASAQRAAGTLAQLRPGTASPKDQTTRFVYDGQNRQIGEIDAEGFFTEQLYDDRGNVVQRTRYAAALTTTQLAAFDAGTGAWRPASTSGLPGDRTEYWHFNTLGQLDERTDADGTVTRLSYDEVGRVVSTTRAVGTLEVRTQKVRYDGLGRVTGELSARGAALLVDGQTEAQVKAIWAQYGTSYTYDEGGRKTSQSVSDGTSTQRTIFFYNEDGQLTHTINALGEVQENQYDGIGQLVKTIAYGGRLSATTFNGLLGGLANTAIRNAVQELLAQRTPGNQAYAKAESVFDYDARGLIKSTRDALGYVSSSVYDAFGQATDTTRQLTVGGTTVAQKLEYDRRGVLVTRTDDVGGLNAITRTRVDAFGRVYEQIDARGIYTKTGYDRLGRVVQTTDGALVDRYTTYDAFSRVVTTKDGNGQTTTYRYDIAARTVEVTTPENIKSRVTRNRHGEVASATDGAGVTTTYAYTENGELKTTTTPLNGVNIGTGTKYDSLGRVAESTDANGTVTRYGYDALNRVTSRIVDPDGANGLKLTTTYAYEDTATGSTVLTTEADGRQTLKSFDVAGRLVASTVDPFSLALTTSFELDADGRTLKVKDPNNIVTRYEYDKLGRRTAEVTDDAGNADDLKLTRTYVYDLAGRLTSSTDWTGTSRTRYAYDDANRLIYQIDSMGAVRYTEYDGEGRERRVTRLATPLTAANLTALGTQPTRAQVAALVTSVPAKDEVTGRVFDKDGRVQFSVDAAGTVTGFRYDGAGRVKQQIVYGTAVTTATWMDGTPQAPADNPDDRVTSTLYDDLGRATTVVDAEGGITALAYDNAGNLRQKTAYARVATAATMQALRTAGAGWTAATLGAPLTHVQDRVTNYRYDAAGRLRYEYDAEGYVTETRYDGLKTTTIRHAEKVGLDVIPTLGADDRASFVELDKAGRVLRTVDAMNVETRSFYDKGGRLTAQTQAYGLAEATTTGYVYDDAGHVIRKTVALGTAAESSTRYGYDAFGRMTTEIEARGVALAELTSDWAKGERVRLGKPADLLQLSEPDKLSLLAKFTTTHEYDAAGRRKATINAMGFRTSTEYDAFGNAVKVTDPLGNVGYFYFDKLNRVTMQIDPEGNATRTIYWGAGSNQVAKVRRYFAKATNVTTAQMPDPVTSGKDAVTTNEYDRLDRLVSSAATLDGGGSITESTQYGVAGNRFDKQVKNKVGGVAVFNTDKLGNVVTETLPVTVENKAIVNVYEYDAFGNRIKSTEAKTPAGASNQWLERTTSFQFDKMGRLTHRIGERYDAFDGASQTTSSVIPVEWTRYDALGRVLEQVSRGNWVNTSQVVGGVRTFSQYDAAGNKTAQVAADGGFTAYERDAAGNVVRESARGTVATVNGSTWSAPVENAAIDRNTVMAYDVLGRLVSKSRENVRYWEADPASNQILAPLSSPTTVLLQSVVYDAVGNVVQETDGRDVSVYTYYDKLGRKVLRVDAERYAVAWEYENFQDTATTETKYATALGAGTFKRQDDTTQPASQREPAQLRAGLASANDRTTKFKLDTLGRVTEKRVLGVATSYLDSTGRLFGATMDAVSTYQYDGLNNVRLQSDLVGFAADGQTLVWSTTEIRYDALGRETSRLGQGFTDFNGNWVIPVTDTDYNSLGLVSRTTQRGRVTADDRVSMFGYNDNGDRTAMTDALGNYTLFELDARGLVGRETAKASMATYRPELPAGQQVVLVDRVKRFAYDALGRVTAQYDGDAAHAQTGEIRRTRYNVFGDITGKGLGDGWQEFADYNVLGKVERSNSDGGAIAITLYDRNGNATRKIVSAVANLDLGTLTIKQAAEDLNRLNHTFSVYDKRNQLLKTVEFKADYQVSVDGRTSAVSQQLAALYGSISIDPGGKPYDPATGGSGVFPVTVPAANGSVQTRVSGSSSLSGPERAWNLTTQRTGTWTGSADWGMGVLLDQNGTNRASGPRTRKPDIPAVTFRMPQEAPALTYEIWGPDGFVGSLLRGGQLNVRPKDAGEVTATYTVSAIVGNQRVQFGKLEITTIAGEDENGSLTYTQDYQASASAQLVFQEQGQQGIARVSLEVPGQQPTPMALQSLGAGLRVLTGLPPGNQTLLIERVDAAGKLLGVSRQAVYVDPDQGVRMLSSTTLPVREIAGSVTPSGTRVLSFAATALDGAGNANLWLRSESAPQASFSGTGNVRGGVFDLSGLQPGNYEFVVEYGGRYLDGWFRLPASGPAELTFLSDMDPPRFSNFRWNISAPVPTSSPVASYTATLKILAGGEWKAVKSVPAGSMLEVTQADIAEVYEGSRSALNPFSLHSVSYLIEVTGAKNDQGTPTGVLSRFGGSLTYGYSAGLYGDMTPQFSNVVPLGRFGGLSGDLVLSGAYAATLSASDARRWDRNGMNLQLDAWVSARVPGVVTMTYSDANLAFVGRLTLGNDGQVTVSIDSVTMKTTMVVAIPAAGKLKTGSLTIWDRALGQFVSRSLTVDEKGRFGFQILSTDVNKTFDIGFTVEDDNHKTLLIGKNVYTANPDGSATLDAGSAVFQDAYLEFPAVAATDELHVRVRRIDGAGTSWSEWALVQAGAGTKRQFLLQRFLPASGTGTFEFEYKVNDAVKTLNKGHGGFTLGSNNAMSLGTIYQDRTPIGPISFLGPSVTTATQMRLTLTGPNPQTVTLAGVWNGKQMVYTWQQPLGGAIIETATTYGFRMEVLDAQGRPVRDKVGDLIDPVDGEVTFGTTAQGNDFAFKRRVLQVNDSAQVRRYQSYNAFGEISEEYDDRTLNRAQAMVQQYHDQGLGDYTLDANAVRTLYAYNTLGQLISRTDPETFETLENGFVRRVKPKTNYGFDLIGRNVSQTDANRHTTRMSYVGGSGQVATRFNADETSSRVTGYDIFLDARKQTNELLNVVLQDYDKLGRLLKISRLDIKRVTRPGVSETLYEEFGYDAFGRISHKNPLAYTDQTFYDSLGRVISTISAGGAVTKYEYVAVAQGAADPVLGLGRLDVGGYRRKTINADLRSTVDEIDYFGRTTWHSDLSGIASTYNYSFGGQLVSQTRVGGQDIAYNYMLNGLLSSIVDRKLGTITQYGYDDAGNRTLESQGWLAEDLVTVRPGMQSTYIQYDELNRIARAWDKTKQYDLRYEYDAVGNRRTAWATYWNPTTGALDDHQVYWYKYDKMDRFVTTMGTLATRGTSASDASGQIGIGASGKLVQYDALGQRTQVTLKDEHGVQRVERYTYTADGYLEDTYVDGITQVQARRTVDAAGRTRVYQAWQGTRLLQTKSSTYDADNRLLNETLADQESGNGITTYNYLDNGFGVLGSTVFTSGASTQTTVYTYLYRDTAQKDQITSTQTGVGTGTTRFSYDVNGYLTTVVDQIAKTTMRYKTNAQGLILSRDTWETGKEDTTTITHWYFYADGRRVGDVGNDGASERVSYVEQLAQLGLSAKERDERNKNPKPVTTADFDQNYEPINAGYPGAASSSYTVRAGDTLSSIAQSLWGDSAMWYMIADVNGLKGGEALVEGQVLVIPNKLTNIHNNATTYRPYNAGEAIGNVNPTLPEPPPPPAKGGCGGIGMILMVVVAVVVSYVTAGAAAPAMATMLGSQAAGYVAAAAIGAAAGSVASQAVGLATGTIDRFSWKAVGQAAISAAITAGVTQGIGALASTSSAGEAVQGAAKWLSQPNNFGAAVARGVVQSSVSQAMQGKWSWKQVGASAVSSGAGYVAGEALGNVFDGIDGGQSLKMATTSAVGSWASSQVMGYNSSNTLARMSQAFMSGLGQGIGMSIALAARPVTFTQDVAMREAKADPYGLRDLATTVDSKGVVVRPSPLSSGTAGPLSTGATFDWMSDSTQRGFSLSGPQQSPTDAVPVSDAYLATDGTWHSTPQDPVVVSGRRSLEMSSMDAYGLRIGPSIERAQALGIYSGDRRAGYPEARSTPQTARQTATDWVSSIVGTSRAGNVATGAFDAWLGTPDLVSKLPNAIASVPSGVTRLVNGTVSAATRVWSDPLGTVADTMAGAVDGLRNGFNATVNGDGRAMGSALLGMATGGVPMRRAEGAIEALSAVGVRNVGLEAAADLVETTGKYGRFGDAQTLADEAYLRYQRYTNDAYTAVMDAHERGRLSIPDGMSPETIIGQRTDAIARIRMSRWLENEGISEGPGSTVQLNRWLRDPSGSGNYRIPDVRIPDANLIMDGTIGFKWQTTPQVADFYSFSGGSRITIVRPTQLGGSYSLLPPN